MKYGSLVFEESEFLSIKKFQEKNLTIEDYAHKNVLELLGQHMTIAMCLNDEDIPFDIITINAIIKVSGASGIRQTFQIVPPDEVDIKKNKISVISSLGASVIGRAVGDKISYGLPGDLVSLTITKVTQPNSANKNATKVIETKKVKIY
ncbi:GreA/GreB family transcription elongation factor [Maribacter caenipelagi]|uniref:GreA/GreB family transcription elongation factor n=1 Tax=Maribacter caenipelagi TaxID=1447781 RepID=A0A4R7D9R3_9FLAO|nr:GreA/GreB family elongation factor [Maribacter caenipelagi]TDS17112.1 GreA/GreB family transcription elongation factor [Maribacter caenipelagi]